MNTQTALKEVSAPCVHQVGPASPDLRKVVLRVKREHPEWSVDRLENAHKAYLDYFFGKNGRGRPSKDVDEIWHAHVLHTKDYARDCHNFLGFFLHHVPDEPTGTCTDCASFCGADVKAAKATPCTSCLGDVDACMELIEHYPLFLAMKKEKGDCQGDEIIKADCQGGGDGCTACGSGCQGGGT